ncbi:MAG: phenylalanine--tRNA ligase subunit alpha [Alphaproteobacteria bacterium]|jgi:phenylalanyl-tRNA synthetase alpha chain
MMDLEALKSDLMARIEAAGDVAALEDIRVSALGKKGEITAQMKQLGGLDPEARKAAGQALNALKDVIAGALDAKKSGFADAELNARLVAEAVDVSQSPRPRKVGRLHPITQTVDEIIDIFGQMGFVWAEGPEIEDDWHNFTALNMPTDHPARQMQDTFYMNGHSGDEGSLVLRTHTSPVQVRTMLKEKPPIRVIVPGRTFRSDSDATHTPMFHQVEGLVIDKTSNMAQLKGCLLEFCRTFFRAPDLTLQFRPSYFPFTEPSAEVDIRCDRSGGKLVIGEGSDWLEVLGSGMVNPRVIEACGLDPDEYQGFAFGLGIERLAMLKYGIPDLRTFFDGDVRWLQHYGFEPHLLPSLVRGR